MTLQDHFLAIDSLRRFTAPSKTDPSFKYVQLSGGKPVRSRTATLVLYPVYDDNHYRALQLINDYDLLAAGIMHDKDKIDISNELDEDLTSQVDTSSESQLVSGTPDIENIPSEVDSSLKKIHDHLVIRFPNPKTNTAVAKYLGVSSNYVKMFSDKLLNDRLMYLTHFGYHDKVQYPYSDLFGPLSVRYLSIVESFKKRPSEILLDILLKIRRTPADQYIKSTNFFIDLVRAGHESVILRFRPIIKDAIIEHNFYANFLKQEGIREYDLKDHDLDYNPDGYLGRLLYNKN